MHTSKDFDDFIDFISCTPYCIITADNLFGPRIPCHRPLVCRKATAVAGTAAKAASHIPISAIPCSTVGAFRIVGFNFIPFNSNLNRDS